MNLENGCRNDLDRGWQWGRRHRKTKTQVIIMTASKKERNCLQGRGSARAWVASRAKWRTDESHGRIRGGGSFRNNG